MLSCPTCGGTQVSVARSPAGPSHCAKCGEFRTAQQQAWYDKYARPHLDGVRPSQAPKLERAPHIMQFFVYAHLPSPQQAASRPFCELAEALSKVAPTYEDESGCSGYRMVSSLMKSLPEFLPPNPERDWVENKLREAGDACVERYPLEDVLRCVLEAKDCAVRAVTAKQH